MHGHGVLRSGFTTEYAALGQRAIQAEQRYIGETGSTTTVPCIDIANEIYAVAPSWHSSRAAFFEALKHDRPTLEWNSATGTFELKPPALEKQTAVDIAAYDLITSETQLNLLAIWYSQNGCYDNIWPDATTNPSGTPTSGGYSFQCHDENWEISFDGGYTWAPIVVSVCEFVNMMT